MPLWIGVSRDKEQDLRRNGLEIPRPERVEALIDTGAAITLVDESIIEKFSLTPVTTTKIGSSWSDQSYDVEVFDLKFIFPTDRRFIRAKAGSSPLNTSHQCILGMNMLRHSLFVLLGEKAHFTISI